VGTLDGYGKAMKQLIATFALALAVVVSSGHVGDPNAYFEGMAGPYPISVVVRAPRVIPGLADVMIRVRSTSVQQVQVQPVTGQHGVKAAPRAEVAHLVSADSAYHAKLWLMTQGSYSVRITVSGTQGVGSTFVPVSAMPMGLLQMTRGLGVILSILGLVLFFGVVSIVGAATREASLKPGVQPDADRRKRAAFAMAISAIVLAVVVSGGWSWWQSEDRLAHARLFKPMHSSAIMMTNTKENDIGIIIDDADWVQGTNRWSPLVPDHGKIMHLFMISDQNAFAHLHPVTVDRSHFLAAVPADLPIGRYRVYADIVHQSGFAQTLVDSVDVQMSIGYVAPKTYTATDPDDSWTVQPAVPSVKGSTPLSMLQDGSSMAWVHKRGETIVANEPNRMTFVVHTQDGKLAPLEPYMGMLSHAVVRKLDGSVFEHLHPAGNVSMAAQQLFENHARDSLRTTMPTAQEDSIALMNPDTSVHRVSGEERPGVVHIPYAFPTPGKYRMWVQVKRGGRVLTGVFDVTVQ
jgi:hypothetical protein